MSTVTLRALEYFPPGTTRNDKNKETKTGVLKYDGNAVDFAEWKFRTHLR